ncbi:MAG: 3-isopropylmalate dehydrogenase [Eubacteriales bacterium]|nr:3-isopropylmalate dehydrogenase [Eubacteriales bacterium]
MKNILCLPGDGIGPEIMKSALAVLAAAAPMYGFVYELREEAFGGAGIDRHGHPFADCVKEAMGRADAVLLGAIGGPKWDDASVRPEQGLLAMRKFLGVYANVRPLKVHPNLAYLSPLKEDIVSGTDLVIVRELTGGAYFGEPRELLEDFARDSITYSRAEIERIARYAFETAMKRDRRVTSVDKANVLASSKLWRSVVCEVAKEYPAVTLEHMYVDAMAMALVTNPKRYDVIVTENLFGDILSDEASVLGGSLGLLSSGSFGADGPALYEPAHGSAPDIAGQNIANPIAMIYSLTMMLRYSFGATAMADAIDKAVDDTLRSGAMTKDLNPDEWLSATDWTQRVIDALR